MATVHTCQRYQIQFWDAYRPVQREGIRRLRKTILQNGFDPVLFKLEVIPKSWWDCQTFEYWVAIKDQPLPATEFYYLVGGFHRISLADANGHIKQFRKDVFLLVFIWFTFFRSTLSFFRPMMKQVTASPACK